MRRPIALLLAAAGLAACAPTSDVAPDAAASRGEPRQCFDPARIVNFTRGETGTLYVRALNRDIFEIGGSTCPDIGAGATISITPALSASSRLCVGDDAQISQPATGFGPARCRARVQKALTEAEVEALPSRYRP